MLINYNSSLLNICTNFSNYIIVKAINLYDQKSVQEWIYLYNFENYGELVMLL